MILDWLKRIAAARQVIAGGMMEVERGTVIDQRQAAMPVKHICVARGTINIAHIGVEPDDARSLKWIDTGNIERVKRDRAGQIVQPQIQPLTGLDQRLDLKVWLGTSQHAVEFEKDDFGHG